MLQIKFQKIQKVILRPIHLTIQKIKSKLNRAPRTTLSYPTMTQTKKTQFHKHKVQMNHWKIPQSNLIKYPHQPPWSQMEECNQQIMTGLSTFYKEKSWAATAKMRRSKKRSRIALNKNKHPLSLNLPIKSNKRK